MKDVDGVASLKDPTIEHLILLDLFFSKLRKLQKAQESNKGWRIGFSEVQTTFSLLSALNLRDIEDMGKVPPVYILAAFIPAVMIAGIYFFDLGVASTCLLIAILLKIIMKRQFSIIQWEALALLLIGISINQMQALPEGSSRMGVPLEMGAYIYIFIFVTVPSLASVFNEYALKSQYDTSIYLQNLFLYGYVAIFSFLGILGTVVIKGPESFDILHGRSKATMLLIINNAGQVILSSFFFKYADTIFKKYSATVATIFTGFASATLFGHTLTINFLLGISTVFISMHQVCDSDGIGIQDAGVNMFVFFIFL
ncbi:LOW QUALITY PROTEIN: CMP-sialic acid transporter 2 [Lactuca sativa]|uniref:LOW QUALITY PROTEIN: CMP-sialic acid transporter 2 n=1 Tax=Lactuca sativa TaxID=4236 RepID=UPI0022AFC4A8|nr:LOW QUALITY PROTEIN: CMP-sialic acid transporter 2 [Lactuca sativa]